MARSRTLGLRRLREATTLEQAKEGKAFVPRMSPPPAPVRGYPLQLLDELRKDDTSHSSVPSCGMKLCFQPRFAGKEHDVAQPPPRSKRRLV